MFTVQKPFAKNLKFSKIVLLMKSREKQRKEKLETSNIKKSIKKLERLIFIWSKYF
jgi:hypothetical protein